MRLRSARRAAAARNEGGAIAIVVAAGMTAILVAVAMVLDFGIVRMDRQTNKAATDAAATAGMRGMDGGGGDIYTYRAVCQALTYLKLNKPDLAGLTWSPCTNATLLDKRCNPADSSTWASFQATTGAYEVTIQNPYKITASGFPEESLASLASDNSPEPAMNGCDQIGVTVKQTRSPGLGSLATTSDLVSVIRSVGRVDPDGDDHLPVAMLLLEKTSCKAIDVSGTGTQVYVDGFESSPGLIQADSLGTTNCTGGTKVINSSSPDGIVAGAATMPPFDENGAPTTDPPLAGILGSVAMRDGIAANAASDLTFAYGLPNPPKHGPQPRRPTTRAIIDKAYRLGVQDAITQATTAWAQGSGYSLPAGQTMTVIGPQGQGCQSPTASELANATALYINCSPNWNSATEFKKAKTVIIAGAVSKNLSLPAADRVFILGGSGDAIKLTNGDEFRMHHGVPASGPTPRTCADTTEYERARLVIRGGAITQSGGLLQMCHTSVIMMGSNTGGCVPPADGAPPYDSPCPGNGVFTSTGNGYLVAQGGDQEWTAPNRMNTAAPQASDADRRDLEDLALWTETAGASHKLTGGGVMHLSGVFSLPNAHPFSLHGGSNQSAPNAQYIVRSLNATGGGRIYMRPNPYDSPRLPALQGFDLVR